MSNKVLVLDTSIPTTTFQIIPNPREDGIMDS